MNIRDLMHGVTKKKIIIYSSVVIFLILSSVLLFYLTSSKSKLAPQAQEQNKKIIGAPARLKIPAISVDANIQYVGVNTKGEMEVPSNTIDVGWFKLGPRPGDNGSAVISGHFNGADGHVGVFANLHKLKKGDKFYIKDDKGKSTTFVVKGSRIYDPGYAEEIFSRNDTAHLNLVTCDGTWDGFKKSYNKRLVVFADIAD